jgi:hypothetical protein
MSYASDVSRRLSQQAEAVCRTYLPDGRRQGNYWTVGDVSGEKGGSLYVHLSGDHAGKWRDAATAQHGDLLDLIRANRGFTDLSEALKEARLFLRDPERRPRRRGQRQQALPIVPEPPPPAAPVRDGSIAAERLFSLSGPVPGTLAETYLRSRAITAPLDWPALRFHPSCYYRPEEGGDRQTWPALIAAVTDPDGKLTGLHRTWLARDGSDKAPFEEPRRALGHLLGNAVRFGRAADVMAAGEGIETVLSLLSLFPSMPMAAALTVAHLCGLILPSALRRLYVLRENDHGGAAVEEKLGARCREAGIACIMLRSAAKDLNDDLMAQPADAVKRTVIAQLDVADIARFAS